ncbi:hypothetical protein [Lacticaseibacillus paracasei]|uniref:hypothetical protein n=1 Tax=Lacticaseibacillus paracasei TaxID=1597 RepID=UPI0021A50618|nr:hypothetical protein [Lacticaseibacillus paracasei]MCT3315948.1 hypothetical protein [Lacticaseibacillus paracasei]
MLIPRCKISGDTSGKTYTPIQLEKIKLSNPSDPIFDKLACPICGIKLDFKMGSPRKRAHLSTWPNQKHLSNCNLFFIAESRTSERKNSVTSGSIFLNEDQRKQKIDYLLKKIHDQENPNPSPTKGTKRIPPKKKNPSKSSTPIPSGTNNPNDGGTTSTSKRTARTENRLPGGIDNSLVGKTILLFGDLTKVNLKIVDNHPVMSVVISYNSKNEIVRAAPSFFSSQQIGLYERFQQLEQIINIQHKNPSVTLFVDVQPNSRKGTLEPVVYTEGDLRFPRVSLGVYIGKNHVEL